MSQLKITLLGAPCIERDNQILDISLRKGVALLAYLAVNRTPQTRDSLAALLWPDANEERARGTLRFTLARLKSALDDRHIYSTRDQISLLADTDLLVDTTEVAALCAKVEAHGHSLRHPCAQCKPHLVAIEALMQAPLLSGFSLPDAPAFDDWLFYESERLQRILGDTLAALIALAMRGGDAFGAIPYAQRLAALDPLQEEANHFVIRLLVETGQHRAAQRHYAAFTRILREELGAEPPPATASLVSESETTERGRGAAPPITGHSLRSDHVLPRSPTTLVGREHELAAIGALLDDPTCRLITLLGPGGSGKTRMALAIAEERQKYTIDPALLVPLAGIDSVQALESAIAINAGYGALATGDRRQQLLDFLKDHQQLIVLDNLEELLSEEGDAASQVVALVDAILDAAPDVQFLVTSRTRLHMRQEQIYPVQGLSFPEVGAEDDAESYAAIQLFLNKARKLRPDFFLTKSTRRDVISVVQMLAGQPLAIELAAAWVSTLAPSQIAAELTSGIDLLTSNDRNIPERHRSMRATYMLTWQRLQPETRRLQQVLSVFRGSFTYAAASSVANINPALLQGLLDQSLLEQNLTASGEMRYGMHELLRQFATEHLETDSELQHWAGARHAAYYLEWLAREGEGLAGARREKILETFDRDSANIHGAWEWALAQRAHELLIPAIPALSRYYLWRGRYLGGYTLLGNLVAICDQAADSEVVVSADGVSLLAVALAWKGIFAVEMQNSGEAIALSHRALDILAHTRDPLNTAAHACTTLGHAAFLQGDPKRSDAWHTRALRAYREFDDWAGMARVLHRLGRLAWFIGYTQKAQVYYSEALSIEQAGFNPIGHLRTLSDLAMVTFLLDQDSEATLLFDEAEHLVQELRDSSEIALARRAVAIAYLFAGRHADAQRQYEIAVSSGGGYKDVVQVTEDRVMLAFCHLMQCNLAEAERLVAEAMEVLSSHNLLRTTGFALMVLGLAEVCKGNYARAKLQLEQCVAHYQPTSIADDLGFTRFGLCWTYIRLGNLESARQVTEASIGEAIESQSTRAARLAVATCAIRMLGEGEIEQAVEFDALVMNHRFASGSPFFTRLISDQVQIRAQALPAEVVAAARARGEKRNLSETLLELGARGV